MVNRPPRPNRTMFWLAKALKSRKGMVEMAGVEPASEDVQTVDLHT